MAKPSAVLLILCVSLFGRAAAAQDDKRAEAECPAPVYALKDVSVKPRILSKPNPRYTEEARRSRVSGQVVVEVVLCVTGKATDVEVIRGLPAGLSEEAAHAARRIRFEPGLKDGEPVSVRIRLVYTFEVY